MRFALTLLLLLLPALANAQGAASLVADTIYIEGNSPILIAEGNVEVLYDDTRLTASRVIYDQDTDRMTLEGPITISSGTDTLILASSADIDPQLQNGMLRGARLVLNQQVQLAATQMNRVEGRYSQLYQVAATSCHVCNGRPPLWSIRAGRVIHDEVERQLYFENAQLRIYDTPILWLPALRLPDPTLTRATGLLTPSLSADTQLGVGIKLPYFFRLGDHRDLTLTPYLSASTRTLEWRYRQAFARGDISFTGAVSQDDIRPDETRSYIVIEGEFDVMQDFKLSFDIETVTDRGYLADYGYASKDRLDSRLDLIRTSRDAYLQASLIHYESLRDGEDNATQPTILTQLSYERRLFPGGLGGELRLNIGSQTLYRYSNTDGSDGRDVARFSFSGEWLRDWVLPSGVVIGAQSQLALDYFGVEQDSGFDSQTLVTTPSAALSLSYPLARDGANGARHVLVPAVQLAWSDESSTSVPDEESTFVELDETNLFSLSRYPGEDRRERGLRANIGLTWTRYAPTGWSSTLTFGRVLRSDNPNSFTATSGLDGVNSDWLLSGQIDLNNGFSLISRSLFDDNFGVSKSETRVAWATDRLTLGSSYIWLVADADEDRTLSVSELNLDASYQINTTWELSGDMRYDFTAERPAEAGVSLGYENECVGVDFSVSRSYTSSTSVEATTDFGLSINLLGYSASGTESSHARSCGT